MAAFVVLGAVSCWATSESLHLLMPTWPKILCWAVVITFFIVASIGTKMIVDSLNQKIHVENRGGHLIGGIILVVIFWLCTSMPTNTHTFIYRNTINERVNSDLLQTRNYLNELKEQESAYENEKAIKDKFEREVDQIRLIQGRMESEIDNNVEPGAGPKASRILSELTPLTGSEKSIEFKTFPSDKKGRADAKKYYKDQFDKIVKAKTDRYYHDITGLNGGVKIQTVNESITELGLLKSDLESGKIDLNNADDINKKVIEPINKAYNAIKINSDYVAFLPGDEAVYTAVEPVAKTKRMLSVLDVWGDWMAGKFAGHGFFWWIMLAVLVDIAAFIFFDLAFRRRSDSF